MVSAVRQAAPPTKVIELCKNYSVSITLLCLFYHTGTLALSMTWKANSAEKLTISHINARAKPSIFAFCAPKPCPRRPLDVRTYLPCSTWNVVRTTIAPHMKKRKGLLPPASFPCIQLLLKPG